MQKFLNLSGVASIAAGGMLLAFWFLYAVLLPYQKLDNSLSLLVNDRHWVFVNGMGVAGSILGLVGLVGIYVNNAQATRTIGLVGFILAFTGTVLFTSTLVWDMLIWPILAKHDPTLLDFSGPIYTSNTFVPFFVVAGVIYSLGYLILGISMAKSGVSPYWGSLMIAMGAPLFGLGALFGKLQVYPRTIGVTLLCIGLIWFGSLMCSN
jgi:hypothetical protein